MNRFLVFLLLSIFLTKGAAQKTQIGEWSMHLNYTNINLIVNNGGALYAGTKSGLFSYNESDNSLTTFSKLEGLSSMNITALDYGDEVLVVGYGDGNIDILENNQIINIPHIASANILNDKKINNIFIDGATAYLSCPFGIVVINLLEKEVKETYYLSNDGTSTEVFQTYVFDESVHAPEDTFLANKIFAATDRGLFYADKNDNLLDYTSWEKNCEISLLKNAPQYNQPLENIIVSGLVGFDKNEEGGKRLAILTKIDYSKISLPLSPNPEYNFFVLSPSGDKNNPNQSKIFSANTDVPGEAVSAQYSLGAKKTIILTSDNLSQKAILLNSDFGLVESVNLNNLDFLLVSAVLSASYESSGELFLADQQSGIIRGRISKFGFDPISQFAPNGPAGINIGSINNNGASAMLSHGGKTQPWNNLYNYQEISFFNGNFWSKSNQLIALDIHDAISVCAGPSQDQFFVGTWNMGLLEFIKDSLVSVYSWENTKNQLEPISGTNFVRIGGVDLDNYGDLWLTNSQTNRPLVKYSNGSWFAFSVPGLTTNTMAGKLLCANNGQKWIQLRNEGIMVAKEEKGEILSKKLTAADGLAGNTVNCFVEDNNGSIWIGTSQGLSIFYFPDEIFSSSSYSAEYILIETEDGYVERLFENTEILDIKVDGGNRKWIATKSNGVFLVSEDGTKQIHNFTKENSFLLDNTVFEVSINNDSGEVFFATKSGLCSYRSNATKSNSSFSNALVFPNPVRRNYSGDVAISGISDETSVKVTDISGNLIFETVSIGGTATWNVTDFNGNRVGTGVYLFLCTSADFEQSIVKKVLVYN